MSKIVIYPDSALRLKTPKVAVVSRELEAGIDLVKKELAGSENGAGLAATQLGLNLRLFGIKDTKTKKINIFINPRIIRSWGKKEYPLIVRDDKTTEDFLEGCLSFPDFYGTVKRFLKILVGWEEVEGDRLVYKEKELGGFEAIVWQHEADHLDGILFVDHIKRDGGKFYRWVGDKKEDWDVERVAAGELT